EGQEVADATDDEVDAAAADADQPAPQVIEPAGDRRIPERDLRLEDRAVAQEVAQLMKGEPRGPGFVDGPQELERRSRARKRIDAGDRDRHQKLGDRETKRAG